MDSRSQDTNAGLSPPQIADRGFGDDCLRQESSAEPVRLLGITRTHGNDTRGASKRVLSRPAQRRCNMTSGTAPAGHTCAVG